tara:strand:+ start:1790 stop:2038 length:249 start_codon:yes stop_codon:yes gene_type:complete
MKNSTELPLKKIAEFDSAESEPKLIRRSSFWFCVICVSALAATPLILGGVKLGLGYSSLLVVGFFAAACFAGTRIVDLAHEA